MQDVLVVDLNGTAPTYTYYFAKGLKAGNIDVAILGHKNQEYLKVHPDKLHYIGFQRFPKAINYVFNWLLLFAIAKKYKAIHFQWLPFLNKSSIELYLIKMLKCLNSNLFLTVHNFYPHDSQDPKIQGRYLKIYKIIKHLVVHTDKTAELILKHTGRKDVIFINHGYFYKEFLNGNVGFHRDDVISMLGFIRPYKGVEDAIKVVASLKSKNRKLKLLVAGKCDEKYFQELKLLIDNLQVSSEVVLHNGFLSTIELIETYKKSKISLLPYKKIDQSGVLMTSLGLSVPVVGYDVGGLKEVVKNGRNGYLVGKNDLHALERAIEFCLEHHSEITSNILYDLKKDLWNENVHVLQKVYMNA